MEWPILHKGEMIGELTAARNGKMIELQGSCPFAEGWIYRLYLGRADAPRACYLGVMLPEGRRFVLHKKLPQHVLEAIGDQDSLRGLILSHRPGELVPPEEEQVPAEPPLDPLPFSAGELGPLPEREGFLQEVFGACGGKYVRRGELDYYLAPGKPGEALGPAAFFCLLTWVPWKDSGWWVLCADADGQPRPLPTLPE